MPVSLSFFRFGWIPCDVRFTSAAINDGLSDDSREALKGKRGEDIVDDDVVSQGYEATGNGNDNIS